MKLVVVEDKMTIDSTGTHIAKHTLRYIIPLISIVEYE